MPTAVEPRRLSEGEPGHPTAAQVAAVGRAERRALELLPLEELPVWFWKHTPDARETGITRFYPYATVVYLSDARSSSQVYGTALHELCHVADREVFLRDELSKAEFERRAENFSFYAQGGYPDMSLLSDACRHVDALVARGLSRTAAWQKVNSMHPSAIPAWSPAGGSTRHGHGHGDGHDHGDGLPRCAHRLLDGTACGGLMVSAGPGFRGKVCRVCGRGGSAA